MSNIKLPVSKDTNWGPALNSYLSQLENRVGSIEGQIAASATDNSKFNMANATYASSGWSVITADLKGEIKDNTLTVVVNGTAYYGGTSITPVVYDNRSYTVTLDDDKAYFVYLKYDNNETTLKVYSEYQYGYSYILVGFVKRNKKFVPYYQTCTQSQFQQKYDLDHIWGNMDNLYVKIDVDENGAIKVSATTDSKYIINGLNVTKRLFVLTDPEPAIKYTVSGMAKPIYETIVGEKEPQLSESGTYESGNYKDYYRYGRILVDVFGDIYVQYPNISNDTIKNWKIVSSDQPEYIAINNQLYNLAFYNINDEKLGYRPNMMLEVGRFAIVRGTVGQTYSQDGSSSGRIYFAKALNAGVMCQQSQNAWVSNTGSVALSAINFSNNYDSPCTFKLKFKDPNRVEQYVPNFIIDWDKAVEDENDESNYYFMFEKYKTNGSINLSSGAGLDSSKFELNNGNLSLESSNAGYQFIKINADTTDTPSFKLTFSGGTEHKDLLTYTLNNSKLYLGKLNIGENYWTLDSDDNTIDLKRYYSNGNPTTNVFSIDDNFIHLYKNVEFKEGYSINFVSDRRCKENISALKFNYLDTILKTPVVHYNYLNDSIHQVGIIAQDLEDNLPANQDVFIRKTNSDGLKNRRSIAETKLVYILWKGLQEEAQARKKLEKELEELKNKIK